MVRRRHDPESDEGNPALDYYRALFALPFAMVPPGQRTAEQERAYAGALRDLQERDRGVR